MVQPPDYYTLMAMREPPRRRHHDRPVREEGSSLRSRLRTLAVRTTLGPRTGDHVLGENQWSLGPATR